MNERTLLMNKIKKYSFTLKELNLYLDTHPNCRRALALFNKYNALRQECVNDYVSRFGSITPDQNTDSQHWSWIDDPWPWERS